MPLPAQPYSASVADWIADAPNVYLERKHVEDAMFYDGVDGVVALVRDRIADRINNTLAATQNAHVLTAHGVQAIIDAHPNSATDRDPAGVVTTCHVAGHPDVAVHVHDSTTVDNAVTIAVDAPEGTTIRLDVNDGEIAETTVGQ